MNEPTADGPTVDDDPLVRTALELLPIPPHDDEFWARLEVALDAEPAHEVPSGRTRRVLVASPDPARGGEPVVEPIALERSLAVVPPAFRRTSNAVLAVVAAAAVAVVAVAGNTLMESREGTTTVEQPAADAALETLVRDAQSNGTVTTLSAEREDASSEAVLSWVDHLGSGDAEAAWAALGDTSQAHFGSQAEFEGMMTDLAEGYGAWSAADPDQVLVTPVMAGDDATMAVVTLIGTVEQEGTAQSRADAFPIRIVDGDVELEPFASAGELEVVIPEPAVDAGAMPEAVGVDEELVFVLPEGVEAPVLRLDDGDTVTCGEADGSELGDLEQSSGQRCAYLPPGGFAPGAHTITIAFVGSGGGAVTAETVRFEAA